MVSIVILSYNTSQLLKRCVRSIYNHISSTDIELIVVDNNSNDDSVSMLRKEFHDVIIIENKKNEGFTKGNNIGALKAKGDYLLFLNSDIEFIDDSINKMIDFARQNPLFGVLGGRLLNQDGSIQESFGSFYNLGSVFFMLFLQNLKKNEQIKEKIKYVDWVSGAFFLIKTSIFLESNKFDENIFMYVEDVELCYRVKKLGYKVVFYPIAKVIHCGQGSSSREFAILNIYKGLRYFYRKHKTKPEYVILDMLLRFKAILAIGFGIVSGNSYLKKTYIKALTI